MSTQTTSDDGAVETYKSEYPVRKHDEVYRYRVTIPRDLFDEAGVEDRDRLGVRLETNPEGYAVIVYTTATEETDLKFSASKHSSGELSIPSALGASLKLDNTSVRWERVKRDDGEYDFRAVTEGRLPLVDTSQARPLRSEESGGWKKPLRHVTQDVDFDGDQWEQEHFQLYLQVGAVEKLGWAENEDIGIKLVRVDGSPAIYLTPDTQGLDQKSIKTVRTTGDNQRDRILYVPNGIVRTLGLVDEGLAWQQMNSDLLLTPF